MNILFLYQDVQSGAKNATEAVISSYRSLYPSDRVIAYRQNAHRYTGVFSYMRNVVWSMWDFWKTLNSSDPVDCIVSTMFTYVPAWKLSSKKHVPAIFYLHGDRRFAKSPAHPTILQLTYHRLVAYTVAWLQKIALLSATRIALVSSSSRHQLAELVGENHHPPVTILPNGVDTKQFYPLSKNTDTHDRPQLGYVGRMDEKKGIHLLLEALTLLHTPVDLWIGYPKPGDEHEKSYKSKLDAYAATHNLSVHFLQDPLPVSSVYHRVEYLVLPSQQEMSPLVILEALACGTIPITTNAGEAGPIVSRISDTLILSSTEPSIMASHIQKIIKIPKYTRVHWKKKGILLAKKYTWEKSAKNLRKSIQRIQH